MKEKIVAFFKFNKSIQGKIFIAFSLVTVLALAIVTTIWYVNTSKKVEENTASYIKDNIEYANKNLEIMLKDVDDINLLIATDQYNVINMLTNSDQSADYQWFLEFKRLDGYLSSLFKYKQTIVHGIAVVGLNHEVYKAGETLLENEILQQSWAKRVMQSQGKRVFVRRRYPGTSETGLGTMDVITIGRAIMKGGKPVGLTFIDIRYEILSRLFNHKYLNQSQILITDNDGTFIFHTDPKIKAISIQDTLWAPLYQKRNLNQRTITKIGNQKYLVYSYRSNYTGWTTLGLVPHDILLKDFRQTRNQTLWVVILVLGLTFIVSILIANQITKNIKQLRDIMRQIEEGDLTITPQINSEDEVGELSKRFTMMMGKIKTLMADVKTREQQKRITELKALQTQISPHFLCNTLNIIKYLADLQNIKNIAEVATSLIDLLRYTIGNHDQFVTIREELEHIERYMTIQKYKYSEKFSVIYQVEEEILNYQTLRMILQPIVENALIHGIDSLHEDGLISIKVYREDAMIKFKVTDNGVGMTKEQISEIINQEQNEHRSRFSGLGLKNVDERIKLFFGPDYGLKIDSQPGMYTAVEICIPIIAKGQSKYA